MQIDRSNYEIWFIDWIDGNLDRLQIEQLKLFLNQNPDLKGELNNFTPVRLVSSDIRFRGKEQLKRSISDIPSSRFEFLCTAYLENDLNSNQQEELKEIINTDPDRKKTFDLIQQTKLVPQIIHYKHKNLLLKPTLNQKVKWLSVVSLGAAAAIALIIIIFNVTPARTSFTPEKQAYNLLPDSILQRQSTTIKEEGIITDSIPVPSEEKREVRFASFNKNKNVIAHHEMLTGLSTDSSARKMDNSDITVTKAPLYKQFDIGLEIPGNSLMASNQAFNIPDISDERSQIGKFISKTFREKFLRKKNPADSPLKGYEIAEAGLNGLNKLFGWQMALNTKNDETGQPKSLYFSSKILKVSAPLKKREPQQ